MANFELYYPKLKAHEGGYASAEFAAKQSDKGGETYLGIARNYNPTWEGWKLVDEYKAKNGLPKWNSKIPDARIDKLAKDHSKKVYWDKLKLDEVKNQSLAEFMMDYGFNSGLATPVKAAQGYLSIKQDGQVGPDTLTKINTADQGKLFNALQEHRIKLINGLKQFTPELREGLLKRARSFAYDNKGAIVIAGLGFFFWIVVVTIVYFIVRKKKI